MSWNWKVVGLDGCQFKCCSFPSSRYTGITAGSWWCSLSLISHLLCSGKQCFLVFMLHLHWSSLWLLLSDLIYYKSHEYTIICRPLICIQKFLTLVSVCEFCIRWETQAWLSFAHSSNELSSWTKIRLYLIVKNEPKIWGCCTFIQRFEGSSFIWYYLKLQWEKIKFAFYTIQCT